MFTEAVIACPFCGFKKNETMPAAYSEKEYTCAKCAKVLTPKEGECCVFCSYSNMICPPQQEKRDCCSG